MFWRNTTEAKHRRVRALLSAYLDGQVSPQERGLVKAHLPGCDDCRRYLEELRATVSLVRALPPVTPPRSFALAQAPAHRVEPPLFAWAAPLATATAAGLFALLVLGEVAGLVGAPTGAPPPQALTAEAPADEALSLEAPGAPEATAEPETLARTQEVVPVEPTSQPLPTGGFGVQVTSPEPPEATSPAAKEQLQPALVDEPEAVPPAAVALSPSPAATEAPGPLLQVPALPWIRAALGLLAAGFGALWLYWRRR